MNAVQEESMRIALLGFGTVGLGWAANYLAKGYTVYAFDPAANAKEHAATFLDATWPALRALGLTQTERYPVDRLRVVDTPAAAVKGAAVVHENGPENVATKRAMYAEAETAAPPDAIIASSSGGLPPSTLQAEMRRPERFVIAHPFNPPHLVPLVEVLGGEKTAPETVERTIAHLRHLGKHPIKLQREAIGYLTNRLQFALVREAVHCLVEGIASAKSIEEALRFGLAPRWLGMGSLLTLTLSGGNGGMQRVLDSFAGAIENWWEALGSPKLTPDVKTKLLEAAGDLTQGNDLEELIALRDENLVDILRTLSALRSI